MKTNTLSKYCLLSFLFISISPADEKGIIIVGRSKGDVVQFDNGSVSVLYSTPGWGVADIKVASNAQIISLREVSQPQNSVPYEKQQTDLVLLNIDGSVLKRLPGQIQKYSWNHACTKIAFIQGQPFEGGYGFIPTGVGLYDISTDSLHAIDSNKKYRQASWSWNDSLLFLKREDHGTKIDQFDVFNNTVTTTSYKDFFFSKKGKYYYARPDYESGIESIRVFHTLSNKQISTSYIKKNFFPVQWLDDETLLFRYQYPTRESIKNSRANVPYPAFASSNNQYTYQLHKISQDPHLLKELHSYRHRWVATDDVFLLATKKELLGVKSSTDISIIYTEK